MDQRRVGPGFPFNFPLLLFGEIVELICTAEARLSGITLGHGALQLVSPSNEKPPELFSFHGMREEPLAGLIPLSLRMGVQSVWSRLSRGQLLLLGAVLALAGSAIAAAGVAAWVIAAGWYNVAASRYHTPPIAWVIHTAMIRSVKAHAAHPPTVMTFSLQQRRQGFAVYESHCVMCHGAPGVARAGWVNGMNPPPPYLMDAARRFSPAELRFIVSEGVKMTAMPAWKGTLPPDQITSLVAFLQALPGITAKQYQAMRRAPPP